MEEGVRLEQARAPFPLLSDFLQCKVANLSLYIPEVLAVPRMYQAAIMGMLRDGCLVSLGCYPEQLAY